jgi:NADH-quinone oxidoreductase chain I
MQEQDIIRISRRRRERESYVTPLLKGLQYTLKNFFTKKQTIEYPDQRREVSERWRGLHKLVKDDQGRLKCVACGLCAAICPASAITLTPYEDEGGLRYPVSFEVDELRCIFCGYCQEVCPRGAIVLTKVYDYIDTERQDFMFDMAKLDNPDRFWFQEKKGRFHRLLGS